MRNTAVLHQKITEIAEKLELGYSSATIMKQYSQEWGESTRSIRRYIALAKDIVNSNLKKREKVIEAVRADIIAHEAETWLKSNLELEARLCAIISGKVQFNKTMKKGKETQKVVTYPTCNEVISAIDVLLKLRGVYKTPAPVIKEHTQMKVIVSNEEERKLVESYIKNGSKPQSFQVKNTNGEELKKVSL